MTEEMVTLLFLVWVSVGACCWSFIFLLDALRNKLPRFGILLEVFLTCILLGPLAWGWLSIYLYLIIFKKEGNEDGQ